MFAGLVLEKPALDKSHKNFYAFDSLNELNKFFGKVSKKKEIRQINHKNVSLKIVVFI